MIRKRNWSKKSAAVSAGFPFVPLKHRANLVISNFSLDRDVLARVSACTSLSSLVFCPHWWISNWKSFLIVAEISVVDREVTSSFSVSSRFGSKLHFNRCLSLTSLTLSSLEQCFEVPEVVLHKTRMLKTINSWWDWKDELERENRRKCMGIQAHKYMHDGLSEKIKGS